jgi:hypothetical protein
MAYEKPKLIAIVSASTAIQGHEKCFCAYIDLLKEGTMGAYVADE